jgi:hypothetical protein
MAAADPRFAEALSSDRDAAVTAAGLALTPAEVAVLGAMPAPALRGLVAGVGGAMPEPARRVFLQRAGQALAALGVISAFDGPADAQDAPEADRWLVGGGGEGRAGAVTGSRPDHTTTGVRPDRPRPEVDADASVEIAKLGCTPTAAQPLVQRVLRAHLRGGFRHCYRRALVDWPKLQGELELTFQVGTDGKVVEVRITRDDVKAPKLVGCARWRLASLRFPALAERTVAVLTLRFFRRGK